MPTVYMKSTCNKVLIDLFVCRDPLPLTCAQVTEPNLGNGVQLLVVMR